MLSTDRACDSIGDSDIRNIRKPLRRFAADQRGYSATTKIRLWFARYVTHDRFTVSTTATASSAAPASFALGTRLISVHADRSMRCVTQRFETSLPPKALDYQSPIGTKMP